MVHKYVQMHNIPNVRIYKLLYCAYSFWYGIFRISASLFRKANFGILITCICPNKKLGSWRCAYVPRSLWFINARIRQIDLLNSNLMTLCKVFGSVTNKFATSTRWCSNSLLPLLLINATGPHRINVINYFGYRMGSTTGNRPLAKQTFTLSKNCRIIAMPDTW